MQFGPLHYRHIEADKERYLRLSRGNFDAPMILSCDSLEDIRWWSFNNQSSSRKIHHSSPDVVIHTDASKTGWGAQIENGVNTCGIWSKLESNRHINYLELLAVKLALPSLLMTGRLFILGSCLIIPQLFPISMQWGGVNHLNAIPLLRIFGIGPLLKTFGCQQLMFRALPMSMLIDYREI